MASHGSNGSNERVRTTTQTETRNTTPVDVEIQGQPLSIRSDRDAEFVERLAEYIDGKVAALRKSAPSAPKHKLLMLASLTVAEELFEAEATIDELREEIGERSETILELVEQLESE